MNSVTIYVTYSYNSPLRKHFSIVTAEDLEGCYKKIRKNCGIGYGFTWDEKDGKRQVEYYGLTEVPLQNQWASVVGSKR